MGESTSRSPLPLAQTSCLCLPIAAPPCKKTLRLYGNVHKMLMDTMDTMDTPVPVNLTSRNFDLRSLFRGGGMGQLYFVNTSRSITYFTCASNEPSGNASISIWRMPRHPSNFFARIQGVTAIGRIGQDVRFSESGDMDVDSFAVP